MKKRIEQIVTDSFGDQFYEKALDCLKCLREQCIKVSTTLVEKWKEVLRLHSNLDRTSCDRLIVNIK